MTDFAQESIQLAQKSLLRERDKTSLWHQNTFLTIDLTLNLPYYAPN